LEDGIFLFAFIIIIIGGGFDAACDVSFISMDVNKINQRDLWSFSDQEHP
jgi:hypothetical protein